MTTQTNNSANEALEAMTARALQQAPVVAVPADFAARVRAALPPQRAARRATQTGGVVGVAAALVLVVAMFVLAPHAQPGVGSVGFYVEMLMLAELFGITYWLAAKRGLRG